MTKKVNRLRMGAAAIIAAGLFFWQLPAFSAQGAGTPQTGDRQTRRLNRLATALNLTDAQKAQTKSIFDAARQQAQPLVAQLKQNRQTLRNMVKTGNMADLQKVAATQGSLSSQLIVIRTNAARQFYALLTPEQQQKADQMHQRMMSGKYGPRGRMHHRNAPAQ